jgi:protein-tyrosine phosphatase
VDARTFEIQVGEAPTVEQLLKIICTIRAVPLTKTLEHCSTGLGRAATIGAAYWIEAGLSALEAVSKINGEAGCSFLTADRARVLTELAVRKRAP